MIIKDCDDCHYYEYIRYYGSDCLHEDAPTERGDDEPLAENRHGNFPKWCPMIGRAEKTTWSAVK